MVHESSDEQPAGESSGQRPEIVPVSQPAGADGERMWQWSRRFLGLLREKDDLQAVRAVRQVSKSLSTLVLWHCAFGKGAELVCVRVMAVMEKIAHGVCFSLLA